MKIEVKRIEEMRAQLIGKAEDDPAFRSRLMAEPRVVVEEEFGVEVPEGSEVRVHEDSRSVVHLVLPPEPKLGMRELDSAAGGTTTMCNYCKLSW